MSEPAHYLVFETGGTKLVAAVAGPDQRMVATEVIYRDEADRAPKSFERIVSAAEKLYANHVADGAKFQAIGFGFGGTVRRSTNSRICACTKRAGKQLTSRPNSTHALACRSTSKTTASSRL